MMSSKVGLQAMKRSPEIGRIIAYFFIIVSPVAIFIAINFKTQGPFLVKIADGSALLAFAIFTMQFVLSARLQWIERPFGLDRIFRFHKLMAIVAASLLLVHPVMVAAGDEEFGWSLLFSFRLPWAVLLGKATLFTVMVTAIVGLCRRIFKIEFQKWLLSHNALAILILIAGFVHGSIVGPDLKNHVLRGYMVFALKPVSEIFCVLVHIGAKLEIAY
jgi:predicted ferric reductase